MNSDFAYQGLGGALFAVIGIWSVIAIGFYVWYLWALARLFPYIGLPAAHGWIPVWNQWRVIERGGLPGWIVLLGFIPGLGIAVLVISIIAIHRINQEHGEGAGMTVLGALIAPLWATLLGGRLADRGYSPQAYATGQAQGSPAGGWHSAAPQQGLVEYGPDGQVYPLLDAQPGAVPAAAQSAAPAAPGFDAGWAMPPVQPMAPAAEPMQIAPAPHAQEAPPTSAQDRRETPATAPANPWSLGTTVDDNFERLSQEALAPRDASFGPTSDARPFSWPEPQPTTLPDASVPPVPHAVPVAPEVPAAPAVPVAVPAALRVPPATHAPQAAQTPPASAVPYAPPVAPEDEVGATIVTGGTRAPIESDDDGDHTIVVPRRATWVLELPDERVLELTGDDVVIGRKPMPVDGSTVLVVPDPTRTLSKSHARLRRTGETWTIEDLNSTNGVFVFDGDSQTEITPGVEVEASAQLIIGTLEVRLRTA